MLPVAALLVHERFPFHSSSEQSDHNILGLCTVCVRAAVEGVG
jgi:hypothetical protein